MGKKIMATLSAVLAIAAVMMCCLSVIPIASASVSSGSGAYLLNNGGTEISATTDWKFYVETPGYLALDQSYWNLTVYGQLVNGTGAAANGSYTVTVKVTDVDGTSVTKTSTISVVKTKAGPQYGNISFSSANIGSLVRSDDANVTITLTHSATTEDTYYYSLVISNDEVAGLTLSWMNSILEMVLILAILAVVFKMFEKMMSEEK